MLRIPVIVGGDSGSNVGSDSGRLWAASAAMLVAVLYLLFRALSVKLFPVLFLPFAQGLAFEFEPMGGTQETIQ